MGATNCPETPRQRMIGMMYLVLTAMLALNVSKDILDAFVVVDETLVTTIQNTDASLANEYNRLEQQRIILGEEKVKDALSKAKQLKKYSDDMVNYIMTVKTDLIKTVEKEAVNKNGQPKSAKDINSKDDASKPTNFFINEGRAVKLKTEIEKYRANALSLVDAKVQDDFTETMGLNVKGPYYNNDGTPESWENHNFNEIIMIACVTLLNKTMGEVRNAELMILKHIFASISAEDFKFDKVGGRSIPKSQMVFTNTNYEADIIVAAYDSKQNPIVYYKMGVDTLLESQIDGATKLDGENGLVKLTLPANSVGDVKYAGLIMVKKPDGQPAYYHFKDKYSVVKPSATVAADKMNVLYAGIPNPLSASAPVPPEQLLLSIPGCQTARNSTGGWDVTVPASLVGKQVTASVSTSTTPLGSTNFRVKKVPDPVAYIGGNFRGGRVSKQELLNNAFVMAKMDADFVYDMKWNVLSYRVIMNVKGIDEATLVVSGARFSDDLLGKIKNAAPGTVFYFNAIRVSSPAGERPLPEISIRIR